MNSRRDPAPPLPRAAQDPFAHLASPPAVHGERLPWVYFFVFLAGTALVVAAMWYHIDSQRQSIRASWRVQIESIANDRARLIDNWLTARRADADVLAASPNVRALLTSPRG